MKALAGLGLKKGKAEIKFAPVPLGTFVVPVGGVPFWVTPTATLVVGADGEVQIGLAASASPGCRGYDRRFLR